MTKLAKKKGTKEILKFFGLKEPFFITDALRGKDIQRFVDREDELQDLKISAAILILTDLRAGFYGYLKNLIPGINLKSFLLNVNKGIS